MKRSQSFNRNCKPGHKEVKREIAIHEAGHAAAIYLGNKKKGLPVVFFQIHINPLKNSLLSLNLKERKTHQYVAKIEGGRLIHTLPYSFSEATKDFSPAQKRAFEQAFEADIFNMLIGPLAEAKYVSLRDDEAINFGLVNIDSLHFYGGSSDLEMIKEYVDCYIEDDNLRKNKISDLFKAAYDFISNQSIWLAITALAETILADDKKIIEYEDIIEILEHGRHVASQHELHIPEYFHTNLLKQALIEPETIRPLTYHHYYPEPSDQVLFEEATTEKVNF